MRVWWQNMSHVTIVRRGITKARKCAMTIQTHCTHWKVVMGQVLKIIERIKCRSLLTQTATIVGVIARNMSHHVECNHRISLGVLPSWSRWVVHWTSGNSTKIRGKLCRRLHPPTREVMPKMAIKAMTRVYMTYAVSTIKISFAWKYLGASQYLVLPSCHNITRDLIFSRDIVNVPLCTNVCPWDCEGSGQLAIHLRLCCLDLTDFAIDFNSVRLLPAHVQDIRGDRLFLESHKAKSTGTTCVFIKHHNRINHCPKLLKETEEVTVFHIGCQAANKKLSCILFSWGDSHVALIFTGCLRACVSPPLVLFLSWFGSSCGLFLVFNTNLLERQLVLTTPLWI
mmetsp:Transcript_22006/g.44515  ORF Transcript_22006/g.44515 Transcript_22006/m.44515 type:complete len:340 (+) Transcript_22006:500-1519(+)